MPENKPGLPPFLTEKDIAFWTGKWHAVRRVLVQGELNLESLGKTTLELMKLDAERTAPITLMISSGGGKVISAHQLEDTINALNSPVDALMIGDCASMAVDLMLMCRKRMMLPSARLLVHYVRNDQFWVCDDLQQLEQDIVYFRDRMRETADRRMNLYVRRTGLTKEKIAELFRQGEVHKMYFIAKQAMEMNLIDEVVTDFKFFPERKVEE